MCARLHGNDLGWGHSLEEAAEIVRRLAGADSIKDLIIPGAIRIPRSVARADGVFWRKPGLKSLGGWWVPKKGLFKTLPAAVACAAKMRGLTQKEQLRKRVAPRELCARLRALSLAVDSLPADLRDLVDHAHEAAPPQTEASPFPPPTSLSPGGWSYRYG